MLLIRPITTATNAGSVSLFSWHGLLHIVFIHVSMSCNSHNQSLPDQGIFLLHSLRTPSRFHWSDCHDLWIFRIMLMLHTHYRALRASFAATPGLLSWYYSTYLRWKLLPYFSPRNELCCKSSLAWRLHPELQLHHRIISIYWEMSLLLRPI